MWKLDLKQAFIQSSTTVHHMETAQRGNRWGSSSVIVSVAIATKTYYPRLSPPPSTPPPAEKVIVPGCSDNCWNNNSEINGFYVLSETHLWTAETRCQDWSCQCFILLHSSSQSPAHYMLTYSQCTCQRYMKSVWLS